MSESIFTNVNVACEDCSSHNGFYCKMFHENLYLRSYEDINSLLMPCDPCKKAKAELEDQLDAKYARALKDTDYDNG